MPKIQLDDIEFNTEDLSEQSQAILKSLQFVEVQLQKLKSEIAVYQTAQQTYAAALKEEIKKSGVEPIPTEDTSEE
jgi:hypothetical protein